MRILESNCLEIPQYIDKLNLDGDNVYSSLGFELINSSPIRFERYGGWGSAGHGGGARSVILDEVQVKGVGVNPLLGSADINHSHGTLTLSDAVYETIYSEILKAVLPLGTVRCHAIYYTGDDKAHEFTFSDTEPGKTHGALLVRDNAFRPAGLLRSREYSVPDEWQGIICSDIERIRHVFDEIKYKIGDQKAFINFLGKFISTSANQFGFARMAGLYHGAVTPSNLSIDSKWLDLATTSFIERGKNYLCNEVAFFQEASVVQSTLTEIIMTYSKYCRSLLYADPLIKYFTDLLQKYEAYHCVYALGIDRRVFADVSDTSLKEVTYQDLNTLFFPRCRIFTMEELREYKSTDFVEYLRQFYKTTISSDCTDIGHAKLLYRCVFAHGKDKESIGYINYVLRGAIKAFKRAVLIEGFYSHNVRDLIDNTIQSSPHDVGELISNFKCLAEWILCDSFKGDEVVFSNNHCSIEFSPQTGCLMTIDKLRDTKRKVGVEQLCDLTHPLISKAILDKYFRCISEQFSGEENDSY